MDNKAYRIPYRQIIKNKHSKYENVWKCYIMLQEKQKTTFCSLSFLSSSRDATTLESLDKVSLLMLFDCTPIESSRLGCTSVIVLKKSIPKTEQRSWTVLTKSRTLCSLSLCQNRNYMLANLNLQKKKKSKDK